jgi:Na+-transporting NADH:ubiquinone oxidoreductase subunit D
MTSKSREVFTRPLIDNNPVTLQILGICSALAVTSSLLPALFMSLSVICVMTIANVSVSLMRKNIPGSIRLIIQITIVASLVIIVDQVLKAYAYETSKQLSVFIGLIITNCIVLAHTEGFAMNNPVGTSFLDGLGTGLGYSLILITVASVRELFGSGSLLGVPILPLAENGGWYHPNGIMLVAPSGFFIIGLLIWLIRTWKSAQVERHEYRIRETAGSETA